MPDNHSGSRQYRWSEAGQPDFVSPSSFKYFFHWWQTGVMQISDVIYHVWIWHRGETCIYIGVPDQVRTPSQVGTKKILKGGWAILELFEPCRNHDLSLRSQSEF